VPELGLLGTVRGALRNERSYREPQNQELEKAFFVQNSGAELIADFAIWPKAAGTAVLGQPVSRRPWLARVPSSLHCRRDKRPRARQ